MKSTRLSFENFEGPFVTHGIDILSDPSDPESIYIAAINHVLHPEHVASTSQPDSPRQYRPQIELFHHTLSTTTVRHIRSIHHPLIKTPNDIIALSPTSINVTNDHYYLEGMGRKIEDIMPVVAKWSNVIHLSISSTTPPASSDPRHVPPGRRSLSHAPRRNCARLHPRQPIRLHQRRRRSDRVHRARLGTGVWS